MNESEMRIGANRIAVYDSRGEGRPVLFIHGNSANAQTFRRQFESALARDYRLVAFDLPGHGRSAHAADVQETYTLPGLAAVVAGLVEHLRLEGPILAGWSLGGHVALEAVQLADVGGCLIYGTPPLAIPPAMEQCFLPNPAAAVAFAPSMDGEQATALANAFVRPGGKAPPSFGEAILASDGRARSNVGASVMAGNYSDEVRIVAGMEAPLAILHGAQDQLVSLNYLESLSAPTLWRGAVQVIEDAGHAAHWEQPERFNTLLAAFVESV